MIFLFLGLLGLTFGTAVAHATHNRQHFVHSNSTACIGTSGLEGVCLPVEDCAFNDGNADGICASSSNVCCTIVRTCGQETSSDNTLFVNPNYPGLEYSAISNCFLTVRALSNNICQVRLDFQEFELEQPTVEGTCAYDFMTVSGATMPVPIICGHNTGHHMYFDVDPDFFLVEINIDIIGGIFGRLWKISVAQITCTSEEKVPSGCLQYYRDTAGTAMSFNYDTTSETPSSSRQLANTHYDICIESHPGYCSITWYQPPGEGNYFFTITGDATSVGPAPSTPGVPIIGAADCQSDHIIIPNGEVTLTNGSRFSADRFCGLNFPVYVTTEVQPFTLYVETDSTELPNDVVNGGFHLSYRMSPC